MKILSLYWGICSSAALIVDGRVVAACNEERFTRKKNDDAFPQKSIEFCMKSGNLTAGELDGVASASLERDYYHQLTRVGLWKIEDYLEQQKLFFYPKYYENREEPYGQLFEKKADRNQFPGDYWASNKDKSQSFSEDVEQIIAEFLEIPIAKVHRIEHHRAHAYYSYYASPFRNQDVLSFTIDGYGDGVNATIGIFDKEGKYGSVYNTNQCNIARIYRYMTLLLGMKPNEHEYKVMGLAPYGKKEYSSRAIDLFHSTLFVDDIDFKWKVKPQDSYYWFKERLEGVRFDSVAFALQQWVENLLFDWVSNGIKKYSIPKIIVSGGVAMNVKAMGKISEIPELGDIFVGGSSSDESMAISSGICLAEDLAEEKNLAWHSAKTNFFTNLFLGPLADIDEEKLLIESLDPEKYQVIKSPEQKLLAEYLAQGKVIARCAGRMEFGQRALGNRSILCDPKDQNIKNQINEMIKNRDFWMPFAPVILDRYVNRYIVNPKGIQSPQMTIAFQTTAEGFKAMMAACHPADRTVRAQMLKREDNPELYGILEEFEKKTGRGALLNTSFNLHGYPIVNTPEEALYVFENSGLDALLLNQYLILK